MDTGQYSAAHGQVELVKSFSQYMELLMIINNNNKQLHFLFPKPLQVPVG